MTVNLRNTKRTPEKLGYIISLVMEGNLRPTRLAKMADVTYETLCRYIRESRAGSENYLIEFLGERMQFSEAYDQARKFAMSELRGSFEQKCILGYDEIARDGGQVVWKLCPEAAAIAEENRELLGYRKDALLEINGRLVPETIHHEPPTGAVLRALETAFKDYRPSSVQEVTLSGGAAPIGIQFSTNKQNFSGPPPAIPAPPPMPELQVLDGEFDDILGPAPAPQVNVVIAPNVVIAAEDFPPAVTINEDARTPPERVLTPAPAPAGTVGANSQTKPPARPLSDLERDLWSRAQAKLGSAARVAPVPQGDSAGGSADVL
jgi:hypothetical protein